MPSRTMVHCEHCGARYQTPVGRAIVERIRRCRECEQRTLTVVAADDDQAELERPRVMSLDGGSRV